MNAPDTTLASLYSSVRDIPDFPKPGIVFKDITPLLADPALFRSALDVMVAQWKAERIAKIVGIESRGFLLAAPLADRLGAGLVIVRKPGKLPYKTVSEEYALEYGTDTLHLHADALSHGERTLVVDDVLATGGTASAVGRLAGRMGANVVGFAFLIELGFLKGAQKLNGAAMHAVLRY